MSKNNWQPNLFDKGQQSADVKFVKICIRKIVGYGNNVIGLLHEGWDIDIDDVQ